MLTTKHSAHTVVLCLLTFAVFLFVPTLHAQNSPIGLWRSKQIHWIQAPKILGEHSRSGSATLMRFLPEGKFELAYATIVQANGTETINQEESWTAYSGTWELNDDQLLLSYEPFPRDPSHPEAPQTRKLSLGLFTINFDTGNLTRDDALISSFDTTFVTPPHRP